MPNYGVLNTRKTPQETRREIEECFAKWGIEEFRIPRDKGGGEWGAAKVIFHVNEQQQVMECSRFYYYRDNLRALYLILDSLRKAQERGILKELARAAVAMLPPGEGVSRRAPHEVLGIQPDAPLEVAEAAWKALARTRHPDVGGSEEAMQELNAAIEAIRETARARGAAV
jgi:hypothetical protein